MEEENNNQLPFLDVNVARTVSGRIRTTVYRKATIPDASSNSEVTTLSVTSEVVSELSSNEFKRTVVTTTGKRRRQNTYILYSQPMVTHDPSYVSPNKRLPVSDQTVRSRSFWLAIPYVKNVSEATARVLNPFGIGVAHKPESTIRQQIMRPKDPLPATEQSAVVYSIPCQNCNARYVGKTGKRLCTRLHEHQLAVNREDKLSLVYGHMQQEKHSFAFGKQASSVEPMTRWLGWCSKAGPQFGTINRAIDLHPAYQALRTRLQSVQAGPTVLASESRLLQQLSPSQQGERASRRSHDQRETSPHRRAQTAERDSRMQRQLISSSDYDVRAHGHTGLAAITTAGQGAEVTGARHRPPAEGPKPNPQPEGRWLRLPNLLDARLAHRAVADEENGRIFVTGGENELGDQMDLVEYCTLPSCSPMEQTESHSLLTWHRAAPMNQKRKYHALAYVKGKIVAVGGHIGRREVTQTVEVFTPPDHSNPSGQWTLVRPLSLGFNYPFAVAVDDDLFVFPGGVSHRFQSTPLKASFSDLERSTDSEDQVWTDLGPMSAVREVNGVVVLPSPSHPHTL
ncbi:hypothetical protein SprV_0301293500 [Sparganum proliferum]